MAIRVGPLNLSHSQQSPEKTSPKKRGAGSQLHSAQSQELNNIDEVFKKFSEIKKNEGSGNTSGKRKLDVTQETTSKTKWITPPTPKKAKYAAGGAVRPSPYTLNCRSAEGGSLTVNGVRVALSPLSKEGKYKYVYRVKGGEQVEAGIPNENLVVKVYNLKWSVDSAKVDTFVQCSTANYDAVRRLGLPVATIYPSAHCIVQEYVPFTVDVFNSEHIRQVRNFFISSQESNTLMDLYPDNLRVRKKQGGDAEVVLIDFFDEDESDEDDNALHWIINQRIARWCELFVKEKQANRAEADQFLKDFTQGFEKYGYTAEEHKTILDSIFEKDPLPEAFSKTV